MEILGLWSDTGAQAPLVRENLRYCYSLGVCIVVVVVVQKLLTFCNNKKLSSAGGWHPACGALGRFSCNYCYCMHRKHGGKRRKW